MPEAVLLSTAYFAPISYYANLLHYKKIYIEQFEHYTKQTYRNRCVILSANGPLPLSIPVLKTDALKMYTKDVAIDLDSRWKDIHWRAIESAYRSSPFFIYYADDIFQCYNEKEENLLQFNLKLQQCILEQLGLNITTLLTIDYKTTNNEVIDLSEAFSPKNKITFDIVRFQPITYYQVFENKFGFVPNLSILDLLFNLGPSAEEYLRKCFLK